MQMIIVRIIIWSIGLVKLWIGIIFCMGIFPLTYALSMSCISLLFSLYCWHMSRITAYLLLFFVLFTHSAIAMDVHVPHATDQSSAMLSSDLYSTLDQQDCDDLGGHCSHSASHVSGIVPSISLPSVEPQSVYFSTVRIVSFIQSQTPPLRPPKA